MPNSLSLTPELVKRCHRDIIDSGPQPGGSYLDECDYEQIIKATLAARPDQGPVWLFAYGSLIWRPELEYLEERVASARGFHRKFCINMTRWRGTPEQPGLMMGLDRGGQCRGVAYRLPDGDFRAKLSQLVRREMTVKPPTYIPRWLAVNTASGQLTALAFVINRSGGAYAGRLDDQQVAMALATACGHLGSGAEYLHNTVVNLESRGIRDRGLWRLQHLVAKLITERE